MATKQEMSAVDALNERVEALSSAMEILASKVEEIEIPEAFDAEPLQSEIKTLKAKVVELESKPMTSMRVSEPVKFIPQVDATPFKFEGEQVRFRVARFVNAQGVKQDTAALLKDKKLLAATLKEYPGLVEPVA